MSSPLNQTRPFNPTDNSQPELIQELTDTRQTATERGREGELQSEEMAGKKGKVMVIDNGGHHFDARLWP